MKALILAAGPGTRLLPYTHSTPKHMLPIANKPLLEFNVEQVAAMGIRQLGIVVGHRKEQIIDYFGNGNRWGLEITYIEQNDRLGIPHAIGMAQEFIGLDPFVVILGDNLFWDDLNEKMEEFISSGAEAAVGVQEVDDGRYYGIAIMEGDRIINIVEKPENPPSNVATVGLYFFASPAVFDIIKNQKPSARGELEIADTLMGVIRSGEELNPIRILKRWKDTGRKPELLDANKAILEEAGGNDVAKGVQVINSIIHSPCVIGSGCKISNSEIGPFVSIGKNCTMEGVKISNSIVCESSIIHFSEPIGNSIIGRKCRLLKSGSPILSVNIGDHSEIIEDDS